MDRKPWGDWMPGVLSNKQLIKLCELVYIKGGDANQVDLSSIDLHITKTGYRMIKGSVKPRGDRYDLFLKNTELSEPLESDEDGYFSLKSKNTYIFEIKENINRLKDGNFHGTATARSTIGRMDVLARLIVDGMERYDCFDHDGLKKGNGDMYVEITPITFNVRVKENLALTQLRLFLGNPDDVQLRGDEVYKFILPDDNSNIQQKDTLSVDLTTIKIDKYEVAAFHANEMEEKDQPIDLWTKGTKPDPSKYWKFWPIDGKKTNGEKRLKITKGDFYILRSMEKIALPSGIAVYCRAMDESFGEMRIHYAGFVHPCFGRERSDDTIGTPLIFEVRGHDVHVSLSHGEQLAKLIFYRMSQDVECKNSDYNEQSLKLSNVFGDWPVNIELKKEDGSVTLKQKK